MSRQLQLIMLISCPIAKLCYYLHHKFNTGFDFVTCRLRMNPNEDYKHHRDESLSIQSLVFLSEPHNA